MLSDHAKEPLYVGVKKYVRQLIAEGKLQRGAQIPTQEELAKSLGVSRITVVRALKELELEGLLRSRHGVGTFVSEPSKQQFLAKVENLYRTTLESSDQSEHRLLDISSIKGAELGDSPFPPDEPLREIERLRLVHGEPRAHEQAYMPDRVIPSGTDFAQLEHSSIYHFLTGHCGLSIGRVKVYIGAGALNRTQAKYLGQETGAPALIVKRISHDTFGNPVSMTIGSLPNVDYAYYLEFEAAQESTQR